jgi:hypothetical protein
MVFGEEHVKDVNDSFERGIRPATACLSVAKLEEKYQNVLQVNLMRNPNQQKN